MVQENQLSFLNINGVLTPKSGKIIYKGKAITKKEFK